MISLFWNSKAAARAAAELEQAHKVRPWHNGMEHTERMATEAMNALTGTRWVDVVYNTAVDQAKNLKPAQMRDLGQYLDRLADEMERKAR